MPRRIRKHANPFSVRVALGQLDRQATFGREAPLEVEIGSGAGKFLWARALAHPDRDFVGLEVRDPLVDGLMARPDLSITSLLLRTYLLSNGIDQCDRLSMAASVEGRLPLVDYRLVEIAIGLRKNVQDWRLPRKQWLLESARAMVPEHVFTRRKRGFTPPWRSWSNAIFARFGDHLSRGALHEAGILKDMTPMPRPIDALGRPRELLMPALMLEEWARGMRSLAAHAP